MKSRLSQHDELWLDHLELLRSIYVVGMHILSDQQSLNPPAMSDRWTRFNDLWNLLSATADELKNKPRPTDLKILKELTHLSESVKHILSSLKNEVTLQREEIKKKVLILHQNKGGGKKTSPSQEKNPSQIKISI